MRSPLDLLKPDLQQRVENEQSRQKNAHDQHSRLRSFQPGDTGYAKNFGSSTTNQQWLPGHITDCTGLLSYNIILDDGRSIRRHIDHIRPRTDSTVITPD